MSWPSIPHLPLSKANQIIDQINWSVDKFLLGRFAGTTAVAVYGVGGQINSIGEKYLVFYEARTV